MTKLTHIDSEGRAAMVDVSEKPATERIAIACGTVKMRPETVQLILEGDIKKGDVTGVAEIAGVMAAKKTGDLIPLCHPLGLDHIDVRCSPDLEGGRVNIEASARVTGKTGVEMEALTAVTVAALTIYDMAKAVDRSMTISDIRLVYKSGGRSGTFQAADWQPESS